MTAGTAVDQLLAQCAEAFAGMPHILEKISNRYRYAVAPIPMLPELRFAPPTRYRRTEFGCGLFHEESEYTYHSAGQPVTVSVFLSHNDIDIHVYKRPHEALVWYTAYKVDAGSKDDADCGSEAEADCALRFNYGTEAEMYTALVALCTVALRHGLNATKARILGYPEALQTLGKRKHRYVGQAIRRLRPRD
jgi:hypothetical protein